MFIKKIELEKFRNITNKVTLDFESGVTLLRGPSRSGKSSVLKLIRLIILDITDDKLEDYVNENSEWFKGSLEFEHEGINYLSTISYSLKSKKTTRELFIDDLSKPALNTTSDVVKKLNELFEPNLTKNALAMMQGSDSIIRAKDSERLELFKKIKNINYINEAKSIEADYKNLESNDLKEIEIKIEGLKNKTYQTVEEKDLPFGEKEYSLKNRELKLLESNLEKLSETKKALLEEKSKEKTIVDVDIPKTKKTLANKRTQLEDSKKSTYISSKDKYESKRKQLKDQIDNHPEKPVIDNTELEEALAVQQNNKRETLNKIGDPSLKVARLKKPIDLRDELKKSITTLEYKISSEYDIIVACQAGECPTCGKDFSSTDIDKHSTLIESLEKEKEEKEILLQEQIEAFEDYEERVKANDAKKEKLNIFKSGLEVIEANIANIQKNIEVETARQVKEHKDKLDKLRSSLDEVEELIKEDDIRKKGFEEKKSKEIFNIQQDIDYFDNYLEDQEKSLSQVKQNISSLEDEVASLEGEDNSNIDNLKQEIKEYESILSHNAQAILINQKVEKEKEEDKVLLESYVEEKDDLLQKIKDLKDARQILLKDFPNFVIQETIADTEGAMNVFIEEVFDRPMDVSLRSTATSLKLEYGTTRKRGTKNTSGSEANLLTLSFIHTLNEQLGLGCIFLDEADQALDVEGKHELFKVIDKMKYNQIFIITHDEYMKTKLLENGAKDFNMEEIIN